MSKTNHWAVSVDRNGNNLVVIESNCLSGKPSFTSDEEQCIRDCAAHLLAFIGARKHEYEGKADAS